MKRSPAHSFIKERIEREFRVLEQEQVTPWAFLRTEQGVRVKKFDGGYISLGGVEFTGSPRDVFWGKNIRLYLEDIVSRSFEETRSFCTEHGVDRRQPLEETDLLLQGGCSRIYNRMSHIDRRLRGKGFPQNVKPYQPDREMEQMRKFIWERRDAELQLIPDSQGVNLPQINQTNMKYDYDIALSFAGEQRDYVEQVAQLLRASSISVFYDGFEESNLWGKNLYDHLSEVYGKRARYTVMFCSEDFAKKLWTNHERQSAQERAFQEHQEYILPARFDDTEIPGIPRTVGYVDLRSRNPKQFCELILQKLRGDHPAVVEDKLAESGREQSQLTSAAQEMLSLIEEEPDSTKRGIVQIMKGIVPNETAFFPKLIYSGSPMTMKSRVFREVVGELVGREFLFPAEYNETTDTATYEHRGTDRTI